MKILVFVCYQLGDILMSTPVISALYDMGHEITYLCEDMGRELIEPDWIEMFTYNRQNSMAPARAQIKKQIIDRHFDAVITTVPSNNTEGSFVFNDNQANFLYHFKDELRLRDCNHAVELNLQLVEQFSKVKISRETEYRLSKTQLYNSPKNKDVLFHIGAQNSFWRYKAFPLVLYREIMLWLKNRGYSPKVIGDNKQTVYAQMFRGIADDLTNISLKDTKQLMLEAYGFVGNDCGPAHLSAAYRLPNVVFFGPTSGVLTGPWPLGVWWNRKIQGVVPCGPCIRTERHQTCLKPICHDQVTIEDFVKEWKEIEDSNVRRT